MINLLTETIDKLSEHNKTLDDILYVCGDTFRIPKETFLTLADTLYDNGYGGQEVARDLKLIGSDFWLERHEYDGAEWWEYKTLPDAASLPLRTDITALTRRQISDNIEFFLCDGTLEDYNDN